MAVLTLGPIAGALLGAGQGITTLFRNPVLAWFITLFALSVDSFVIGGVVGNGLVGWLLSWVVSNFAGVSITIQSWNILFLIAISPVVIYALKHSVSPN